MGTEIQALVKQMEQVFKLMGKEEFADSIATMLWSIYSKCCEKGFAQDEAMAITLSFAKSQSSK